MNQPVWNERGTLNTAHIEQCSQSITSHHNIFPNIMGWLPRVEFDCVPTFLSHFDHTFDLQSLDILCIYIYSCNIYIYILWLMMLMSN